MCLSVGCDTAKLAIWLLCAMIWGKGNVRLLSDLLSVLTFVTSSCRPRLWLSPWLILVIRWPSPQSITYKILKIP